MCSAIPDCSYKGTFNNLISKILVKNARKCREEEKSDFSIFQRIEGLDASQAVYSKFISTIDNSRKLPVPLCIYKETCKSQKHYKSCRCQLKKLKLQNIKKFSQNIKHYYKLMRHAKGL